MRSAGRNPMTRGLAIALLWATAGLAESQDAPPPGHAGSPVEGLGAKDVPTRRESANQVRLAGKDVQRAALPAMIEILMKEKDGQVRLAVLDAVTSLGPEAEPAVPALLHTFRTNYGGGGQEESHQDYRSALALSKIGKPAVEGLRGLLKERKEAVRAEVVMALGRIGPDAEAAVPDLVPLLGDASPRIRREASQGLGRIGPPAIGPLVAASTDPNVTIREGAVEGLGALAVADDRVDKALLDATKDGAPEVRSAAIRSLAKLKKPDEALEPIVRDNLRHDDERVRLAAVNLLLERRTLLTRMAPEFESLLGAKSDGVARHAAYLLGKVGPDATPRLLGALARPESRVGPIADALAQIGRPAIPPLTKAIEAPEAGVRRGAALALAQIRPLAPGLAPKLAAGLSDPDPEVRGSFLDALGFLGPRAVESVPAVRARLQDESPVLRARAIEVLFQAAPRDPERIGDFAGRLGDPDPLVQRRAIDALRALGPPGREALPVVIGRLGSDDPDVRQAAALFVESHGQAATEAIPALIALLGDPLPKIRTIAAQTLGRFGKAAQPAFAPLTSLLGDERPEIREAVATALGGLELDAAEVRPHLARALRDEKTEVRRAASRAIPRLGPRGVLLVPDIIGMAARKENARSVDRLLRPFERTGPDAESLPELVRLLDHDQVAVRLLAIKFLGLAGSRAREALPVLERIREDPVAEVRQQAKAACEKIKGDAEPGPPKERAQGPGASG